MLDKFKNALKKFWADERGDAVTATLVVTALSTAASVYTGIQASSEQKKAANLRAQADKVKTVREIRQARREAYIKQAEVQQSGVTQGVGDSSGVQGGAGSLFSQGSSVTGHVSQTSALTTASNSRMQKADDWTTIGNIVQSVGSFASGYTEGRTKTGHKDIFGDG
jgi:preprotein translocase subunit SecF